jgi:hypothetical protein
MSSSHSIDVFALCQSLDFEPVGFASFFDGNKSCHESNMIITNGCQYLTLLMPTRVHSFTLYLGSSALKALSPPQTLPSDQEIC